MVLSNNVVTFHYKIIPHYNTVKNNIKIVSEALSQITECYNVITNNITFKAQIIIVCTVIKVKILSYMLVLPGTQNIKQKAQFGHSNEPLNIIKNMEQCSMVNSTYNLIDIGVATKCLRTKY